MGLFHRKKDKDKTRQERPDNVPGDKGSTRPNVEALKEAALMLNSTLAADTEHAIAAAQEAGQRGDWEEAIKNYGQAIDVRSRTDRAMREAGWVDVNRTPLYTLYGERGTAYTYTGDFEAALADYSRALELVPDNVHYRDCLGLVYYQLDKYDQALEEYGKALSLNPPSDNRKARIYANRAATYRELRNYELALKDLEAAAKICTDPEFVKNIKILAEQVLEREGRKDVKKCFQCGKEVHLLMYACPSCGNTVFNISPEDSDYIQRRQADAAAHTDHGAKLFLEKRHGEAETEFMTALDINPVSATAYGNLGVLYLRTGRAKQAVECFEKVKELNPRMEGLSRLLEEARKNAGG